MRRPFFGVLVAIGLVAIVCQPAQAGKPADRQQPLLTIGSAAYVDGLVVITGTTALPGAKVSIKGTPFTVTSSAKRGFRFSVDWSPDDCRAVLLIGPEAHSKWVDGCVAAAGRAAGALDTSTVTAKAGKLLFTARGVPKHLKAGTLIAVNATFEIEPTAPPGGSTEVMVAPCLKPQNFPVIVTNSGPLVFGKTGNEDIVTLTVTSSKPLRRKSISRLLHASQSMDYQIGLCFQSDTSFTVHKPVGYWSIVD
jgi:hypothetical protein